MVVVAFDTMLLFEFSVSKIFSVASELKFDGIAINCETNSLWPKYWSKENIKAISETNESYGLYLGVHAPFHDLSLSSYIPEVREAYVKHIMHAIDFARGIRSEVVVFHWGWFPFKIDWPEKGKLRKQYLESGIDNLKRCMSYAQDNGVTLCLENLSNRRGRFPKTLEDFHLLLSKLPDLHFVLDIAHAYTMNDSWSENFIKAMNHRIKQLHVCDCKNLDQHMIIGSGELDFLKLFLEVKKVGLDDLMVTIELDVPKLPRELQTVEGRIKALELSKENLEVILQKVGLH